MVFSFVARAFPFRENTGRNTGSADDSVSDAGCLLLLDPEDQKIFRGAEGVSWPYEQKISCNWLRLIGLSEHPEEVVIAANKDNPMAASVITPCYTLKAMDCI